MYFFQYMHNKINKIYAWGKEQQEETISCGRLYISSVKNSVDCDVIGGHEV